MKLAPGQLVVEITISSIKSLVRSRQRLVVTQINEQNRPFAKAKEDCRIVVNQLGLEQWSIASFACLLRMSLLSAAFTRTGDKRKT